jgi:superfamily II DNA or RNA helicase
LNVTAAIATYRENEPTTIIKDFKDSSIPWIVSVGMISEGTNIPRLQVCCHLTRIKTELHFRQILGRILRVTNSLNQEANLFMPAESKLIEYARRVAEDIPEEKLIVRFKSSDEGICINENKNDDELNNVEKKDEDLPQFNVRDNFLTQLIEDKSELKQPSLLTKTYEATLNVFGQFQQEILAVNISPFD